MRIRTSQCCYQRFEEIDDRLYPSLHNFASETAGKARHQLAPTFGIAIISRSL
jgi:hypothetical protein